MLLLRAELRKVAHPAIAMSLCGLIVIAISLQALVLREEVASAADPVPAPTLLDPLGAAVIACEQVASLLGVGLAAVIAAVGVASEFTSGTIGAVVAVEGRRGRLVAAKAAAAFMVLTVTVVVLAASLALAGVAAKAVLGERIASVEPTALSEALSVFARLPLVLLVLAMLGVLAGLVFRSEVGAATALAGLTALSLPLTNLSPVNALTLPHWVAAWMGFGPPGYPYDFVWSYAPSDVGVATAGAVLALVVCASLAAATLTLRATDLVPTSD